MPITVVPLRGAHLIGKVAGPPTGWPRNRSTEELWGGPDHDQWPGDRNQHRDLISGDRGAFNRLTGDQRELVNARRDLPDQELKANLRGVLHDDLHGGSVADRFVDHFYGGSATELVHGLGESTLAGWVVDSAPFVRVEQEALHLIQAQFVTQARVGRIDPNTLLIPPEHMPYIDFPGTPPRPVIGGGDPPRVLRLKAVLGGTKATKLSVIEFSANASRRTFTMTLRWKIFDHFGADESDVYLPSTSVPVFGQVTPPAIFDFQSALIDLWVLQHLKQGHRAFVNQIVIPHPVAGSF